MKNFALIVGNNNCGLVKKTVRIANEIGKDVATVDEAKEILGIKKYNIYNFNG